MKFIDISKIIGIGAIALVMAGCGPTTAPLTPDQKNILKGKTVAFIPLDTVTYPSIPGSNGSAAGPNLLISAASIAISQIKKSNTQYINYLYPTGIFGKKITNSLAKKYNMIIKPNTQKTDYTLEVSTAWYYGGSFTSLGSRLDMYSWMMLKDTKTNKIISKVICQYDKGELLFDYKKAKLYETQYNKQVLIEGKKALNKCFKKLKISGLI